LLFLGLGRPEEALPELARLAEVARLFGLGDPNVIRWAPDLVEVYLRVGRTAEAEAELEELARQAETTGHAWARAVTERCRGLLAGEDEFEAHLARALELHGERAMPFDRARTELVLGERLRRARRRADARPFLRSALEGFERLGAMPWAERARAELQATGEHTSPRDPTAAEHLTPQELQVALVVARGATNREAGAALFLSPKTIETHLGRVYRKLGVRSRTELAHRLATEGVPTEGV
jgi:DNA-binding CsgD family transcriptional regulator